MFFIGKPLFDDKGKVVGAYGIANDLSEIKTVQRAIEKRSLIDNKESNYRKSEMAKIFKVLEEISNGVLNNYFKAELTEPDLIDIYKDYLKLEKAITTTQNNLSNMVTQIQNSSLTVTKYSNDLTNISSEIFVNSRDISTEVDESNKIFTKMNNDSLVLSDNSSKINDNIIQISSDTKDVSKKISNISNQSESINSSLKNIAENVDNVSKISQLANKKSETVNSVIDELKNSINDISEIVSTIDGIAEQTNLLALNAAIEAARAGEAGKGFAIVADEIRKLAEKTTTSTKVISENVSKINVNSNNSVDAISEIIELIKKINEIQQKVNSSIEDQSTTFTLFSENLNSSANTLSDVTVLIDTAVVDTENVNSKVKEITIGAKKIDEKNQALMNFSVKNNNEAGRIKDFAKDLNSISVELQDLLLQFNVKVK